jgi:DNA-binding YbaB/EbfC family protein
MRHETGAASCQQEEHHFSHSQIRSTDHGVRGTLRAMSQRMPNDMRQLMQQAQQMQAQIEAAQAELSVKTYEGTAGGGVVKAVVRGSGELVSVDFDPDVLDPDDPEMAGDLVVAAVNQALAAASDDAADSMGGVAGEMDLGGLLG